MSECNHIFNQKPGIVKTWLTWVDKPKYHQEEIERASHILHDCPECCLFFYQEVLSNLKDFVADRSKERVACWGMAVLGYDYGYIAQTFNIERSTVRSHVCRVRQFLAEVSYYFQFTMDVRRTI